MSDILIPMDLADRDLRQRELVPPDKLAACSITVIGVGAIGRQVALQLAAMGAPRIHLVDHDTVEAVNLAPQSYFPGDLGQLKVEATAALIRLINPQCQLQLVPERFRRSGYSGNVVFMCVDSIETRKHIFECIGRRTEFLCDGRMSAEVLRVLSVYDQATREHYPATLFAASEAHQGSCTARSTLYCASVAAGLMIGGFTQWLRGLPAPRDFSFNLLATELIVN